VGDELTRAVREASSTIVARTDGYTYDARVWAMCVVQGPFSVAKAQWSDSHPSRRCNLTGGARVSK
jgi:hypothetical protein